MVGDMFHLKNHDQKVSVFKCYLLTPRCPWSTAESDLEKDTEMNYRQVTLGKGEAGKADTM